MFTHLIGMGAMDPGMLCHAQMIQTLFIDVVKTSAFAVLGAQKLIYSEELGMFVTAAELM